MWFVFNESMQLFFLYVRFNVFNIRLLAGFAGIIK